MHPAHLLAEAAYRSGRGRGLGILFQYLFRWLYSLIGAWAWVVVTGFTGLCLGVAAWLSKGGR
jgi:hypothetical protein